MSAYSRNFDETNYISFDVKDGKLFENTKKLGQKLKIVSKKNLILKQHTTKNI